MKRCPMCSRKITKTGEIRALVERKRIKLADVFTCTFCKRRFI